MIKLLKIIIRATDLISEWSGRVFSWLIGVLVLFLVYETVSRYFFNINVPWVYDMSYMIGGTAIAVAASMALKNGKHVRVDIFYTKLSINNRAILDIFLGLVIFMPLMYLAFINSYESAYVSWVRKEHIMSGNWRPPIYPLKMVIPLTFLLLLFQGVGEMSKNLLVLLKKEGQYGN